MDIPSLLGKKIVLICVGSFNPPTYGHMRMFERARDFLMRTTGCNVIEGILSPCGDFQPGKDWQPARHRLRMIDSAVRRSHWLRNGTWQCSQSIDMHPLSVMKHYEKELSSKYGSEVRALYICGSDMVDKFARIDKDGKCVWNQEELDHLLKYHGLVIVKRSGYHPTHTIYLMDVLRRHQHNIFVIEDETFPNNSSSTRLRTAIRRGESVKYCIDDDVIEYINEHKLYRHNNDSFPSPKKFHPASSEESTTSSSAVTVHERDDNSKIIPDCPFTLPPLPPPLPLSTMNSPKDLPSPSRILNGSPREESTIQPVRPTVLQMTSSCSSLPETSTVPPPPPPPIRGSSEQATMHRKHKRHQVTEELSSPVWKTPPPLNHNGGSSKESDSSRDTAESQKMKSKHMNGNVATGVKREEKSRRHRDEGNHQKKRERNEGKPPVKNPHPTSLDLPSKIESSRSSSRKSDGIRESPREHRKLRDAEMMGIPSSLPYNAFMKPIMTQPQPASDSPLLMNSSIISTHPSPDYDNVTLDELLIASTSWAQYLEKQSEKINELRLGESNDFQNEEEIQPTKGKKKTWFFKRTKSLTKNSQPSSPSEEDNLVRICGSDRRHQQQTSPEILWRKISQISQGKNKERWSDLPPTPKKCPRHPVGKSPDIRENRTLRFANHLARSAENINKISPIPPLDQMSQSVYDPPDNSVTLRFRRYRLTATPETTV